MYAGVMNGKIYIWGCGLEVDIPRTGEVFDPTLNSWSELQHPTLDIPPYLELHAVWEEQNRFLFQSTETKDLYVYDAEQDSWALYDSSYGRRRNKAAVVGEIMYVFHKGEVHAYDLDKRKWFKKAVANLRNQGCLPPAHGPLSEEGTLLHLGNGRLCLIWDQDVGDLKYVHCIKFAVCKERYVHRVALVACAVSSSVFYIKGDRILQSCLAL
ncbi:unnamed protein product [Ilex paraguariensis]|uniref:F-box/kelch-repeat protein n=1 Tax=Ilex paraguariensis TaxID=185542 RepID=A0ABC8RYJ4_9AQUA